MFAYIMRRLIYMPFILLGVILITFMLFQMTSTPETQAKSYIGEKTSQRQIYDWLENKGLISWTDTGKQKIEATANGKLPPKSAHFVAKSFLENTPIELQEFYDEAESMQEDVDDLLSEQEVSADDIKMAVAKTRKDEGLPPLGSAEAKEAKQIKTEANASIFANVEAKIALLQATAKDKGDKQLIEEFDELRGKHGDLKNESITLAQKWQKTIDGARQEQLILTLGYDVFATAKNYASTNAGLQSTKKRLSALEAIFANPAALQVELDSESDADKKAELRTRLALAKEHFIDVVAIETTIQTAKAENKDTKVLEKQLADAKKAINDGKEELEDTRKDLAARTVDVAKLREDGEIATAKMTAAEKLVKTEIVSFEDIEADFTYTNAFTKFRIYLFDIFNLRFGDTLNSRPVMSVIYDGMWPSLMLTLPAFFLAELIGVFFGLFAAMYRQTKIDTSIIVSSILLMSINGIALIMFGQKFLAADLNYFPVTGFANGIGAVRFLILPIFLYIVITFGERIRFNRIVMLDETNQDYVRTARAKGLGENTVLFKHIFRNTLIPLITRWAVAIPSLYLGSLVLESFFSIPGLGYMTVDAIQNSDANVIRAVVVFGSISFMIANLVSDVLYAVADPRVKLS
ncbi:ABC transporter permease subunit [Planctomycetota bacterium]|nr:ABC transporter permease subunit [Planctomycetota bacterium]